MNALTRASLKALPRATAPVNMMGTRRFSTMESLRNNIWLSDPGAYPIIAILCAAVAGCTAYGTYNLLGHPDVRINRNKRQAVVRTWGN